MADARFEDAFEGPLNLLAVSDEDLQVVSALAQDAVLPVTEIRWDARGRRLALLLNRFRWEDAEAAERQGRGYERVQSLLLIDSVLKVSSQGFDRSDRDLVLSVLSVDWMSAEDGAGRITLVLAGDGAIAVDVECIDVTLRDVSRPYLAPSGRKPAHEE